MDVSTIEELIEQIDDVIAVLLENEEECFAPLSSAQQLRDDLVDLIPEENEDE